MMVEVAVAEGGVVEGIMVLPLVNTWVVGITCIALLGGLTS